MSFPPVDKLFQMSEQELDDLLKAELEKIFEQASPERRKRLEALQWKIDIKKKNAPNKVAGMLEVYKLMLESLEELNSVLHGVKQTRSEGEVCVLKA